MLQFLLAEYQVDRGSQEQFHQTVLSLGVNSTSFNRFVMSMKLNYFPWLVLLLILMTGCLAKPMYVPYNANLARGYRDRVDSVHNIYTVEYWGAR